MEKFDLNALRNKLANQADKLGSKEVHQTRRLRDQVGGPKKPVDISSLLSDFLALTELQKSEHIAMLNSSLPEEDRYESSAAYEADLRKMLTGPDLQSLRNMIAKEPPAELDSDKP